VREKGESAPGSARTTLPVAREPRAHHNDPMAGTDPPSTEPFTRVSGMGTLVFLVAIVLVVILGYLHWKAPEVRAILDERRSEIAAAPSTREGRLAQWRKFGDAQIHNRLEMMRFSTEKPWLVAHAIRAAGDAATECEFYGIDLASMPRELTRIADLTIVVRLPRARSLGRGELTGDNAPFVPVFHDAASAPDADERVRGLASWALESLAKALERDIPGAHLRVEVGPEASWAEIAKPPSNR
jgi:hypothetical protein